MNKPPKKKFTCPICGWATDFDHLCEICKRTDRHAFTTADDARLLCTHCREKNEDYEQPPEEKKKRKS